MPCWPWVSAHSLSCAVAKATDLLAMPSQRAQKTGLAVRGLFVFTSGSPASRAGYTEPSTGSASGTRASARSNFVFDARAARDAK